MLLYSNFSIQNGLLMVSAKVEPKKSLNILNSKLSVRVLYTVQSFFPVTRYYLCTRYPFFFLYALVDTRYDINYITKIKYNNNTYV